MGYPETIRYSGAFKLKVICELESGRLRSVEAARRKYGIGGTMTVQKWLRKYGKNHLLSRVVRVETPQEVDRIKALEARVRDLERAVADSKVQETLARAYFDIACEQFGVCDVPGFKKNIAAKLSGVGESSGKVRRA